MPPNTLALLHGIPDLSQFEDCIRRSNIIVTTMALASRMSEQHLELLREYCELIVLDEAHHTPSKTWSAFKIKFIGNEIKILQFTATPYREDGKKVDGKFIYDFPLALAQKQGYFEAIEFEAVEEFNESKADMSIADRAVDLLEKDLSEDLDHIVLVRAAKIDRAEKLFNNIYKKHFSRYNPVLVTSRISSQEKKNALKMIDSRESRIVVGVDMFGEGIDIPNLKIAAIHDKYRSLPITLQFIGRFARAKRGLGQAKIVTNIADEKIVESLEDLYQKDTDWNILLPLKSNKYINQEIKLQEFASKFEGSAKGFVDFQMIRPKVSMVAYELFNDLGDWRNWTNVFDESVCSYLISEEENILIIVEPREVQVRWTNQKNLQDLVWEIYVLYWNIERGIAFVNTTDRSKGYKLAKAIWGEDINTIKSEAVFRCMHGINRLALATVGLNSAIDGPIRYKMFAGIDVAEGVSAANKSNSKKSNIFGIGYEGGQKVSIGCSHKGIIWARWVETIDYWKKWCDHIIDKVTDDSINTKDIFSGVLIPKVIKTFPQFEPYRIDLPNDLQYNTTSYIKFDNIRGSFGLMSIDIGIDYDQTDQNCIVFTVGNDDFKEEFLYSLNGRNFNIKSRGQVRTNIIFGQREQSLEKFLCENPPTVWFVNGASLQGNILIELSSEGGQNFDSRHIETRDWNSLNVDIGKESQLDRRKNIKRPDSIQYALIQKLINSGKYSFVFDDDGSGEIADVIAIKEVDKVVYVEFYHCKYSSGTEPGRRLKDLYEVCAQTEKSVSWKARPVDMIGKMISREKRRLNKLNVSRIELGDDTKLLELKRSIQRRQVSFAITIVQPGVKKDEITSGMNHVLAATQSYCLDTYAIPVFLICSE